VSKRLSLPTSSAHSQFLRPPPLVFLTRPPTLQERLTMRALKQGNKSFSPPLRLLPLSLRRGLTQFPLAHPLLSMPLVDCRVFVLFFLPSLPRVSDSVLSWIPIRRGCRRRTPSRFFIPAAKEFLLLLILGGGSSPFPPLLVLTRLQ